MSRPVVLCITAGDTGGIGPEIVLKAVCRFKWPRAIRLVIAGSIPILQEEARKLRLPRLPVWVQGEPMPPGQAVLWDPVPFPVLKQYPGVIRVDAARAAAAWIHAAAFGCMDGRFDGMVTAPISKEGLNRAGINVPGHTELLAELTHTRKYAMMLLDGPLRVVLATRHLPLAQVPRELTLAGIVSAGELAAESISWLGGGIKPLAVCGLNPHAGDGGVLGHEEKRIIIPAIRALRRKGIHAIGPLPADAVFSKAVKGEYGAVLAMYHDQGLGPFKTVAFESGVNLTLGLPIVRTSPDHGTAFDIAGKGIANSLSMVNAIKLAGRLAAKPNPWRVQ